MCSFKSLIRVNILHLRILSLSCYVAGLIRLKMVNYHSICKEFETMRSTCVYRCLQIIMLASTLVSYGGTEVDVSKALLWTSTYSDGRALLVAINGEPNLYIPQLLQNMSASYYQQISSLSYGDIGYGVLDTGYSPLYLFFSSRDSIYSCTSFSPGSASERLDCKSINTVAVSKEVTGLAYDWVSSQLYWSDAGYQRICVINIGPISAFRYLYWRVVIDVNITSPQDIIIYPQQSYLFWSDTSDKPKIERLNLANDERIVLPIFGLQHPTTLAIDFLTHRLFWLDTAADTLGSSNLDGSNIKNVNLLQLAVSSFVLYEDYIILGNSKKTELYAFNVTGGEYIGKVAVPYTGGIIDMTVWSPERQESLSSPCNKETGGCAQLCVTTGPASCRCSCAMGYFLDPDGKTCMTKNLQKNTFLLVTDTLQRNTFQVDIDTGDVRATSSLRSSVTAMAFDPICRCFYWFDSLKNVIQKTALDNRNTQTQTVANIPDIQIASLAFDNVTVSLFYADPDQTKSIGQIKLSTKTNKVLLSESGSRPRAIVLDTNNRLIYWSDCGHKTIERGAIADPNQSRSTIVKGLSGCVTTFVIDFRGCYIFWGDDDGSITRANLDGTSKTRIHFEQNVIYAGMAIDSNYLYISDSTKRQIQKLNRNTLKMTNVTKILFTQPYAIVYYTNESMPTPLTTACSVRWNRTAAIAASVVCGSVALIAAVVVIVCLAKKCRHRRRPPSPFPRPPCITPRSPMIADDGIYAAVYDVIEDSENDANGETPSRTCIIQTSSDDGGIFQRASEQKPSGNEYLRAER